MRRPKNEDITFISFSNLPGGENIWLHRIAEKMGSQVTTIWDYESSTILSKGSGLINVIVSSLIVFLSKKYGRLARGIYGIIGTYYYRPLLNDKIILFSSSYVPIPKYHNLIAYVHTPSRLLTINFEKEMIKRKRTISKLFLRLWKLVYFLFYKRSLKRTKCILVNSMNVQERIDHYFGLKTKVLYPSVDVESFSCRNYEKIFFYPSRISPEKRQLFALEAFREFNLKNNQFKLIIASTPLYSEENLYYLDLIRRFVEENKLPVEIKIGMSRNEIIDHYSDCYACLFSGKDEDFGQIPLESMASNKPIIAVNEGGVRETIINNINGFLVSNPLEMAEKMLMLADNVDLAKKMGEAGRKHVTENFSDEVFIKNLNKYLKCHFENIAN